MNPRERFLATVVLGIVILAGVGFLFRQFVFAGLEERNDNIAKLRATITAKQNDLLSKQTWMAQKLKEKPRLANWRQLSLPINTDLAKRDRQKYLSELMRRYENYLSEVLNDSGFASGFRIASKVTETKLKPGAKPPLFTPVIVTVEEAHADLAGLVKMMERFYRTSLLHQIKNVTILRPSTPRPQQKPNELDIKLTVEALILTGAEDRMSLLPEVDRRLVLENAAVALQGGPAGLVMGVWAAGLTGPGGPRELAEPVRHYASIAAKDIFFGRAVAPERPADEVQVTKFVHLTDITHGGKSPEAFLFDRYNNRRIRLRASAGFDSFRIRDNQGQTLLRGTVVRIDDRDLVFRVEEAYYSIHVGQSLKEAMDKPLKEEQVKALEKEPPAKVN